MAGNSFMVTVSAPNAPWMHTQTRVSVGHQGLISTIPPCRCAAPPFCCAKGGDTAGRAKPAPRCLLASLVSCEAAEARHQATQLATVSTISKKPTPLAR